MEKLKRKEIQSDKKMGRSLKCEGALIAFGVYSIVLVEGRYAGAFILLFWADILGNIRLPNAPANRFWLRTLGSIAAFGLLANIVLFNLDGFRRLNPPLVVQSVEPAAPPARPLAVAQTLRELGIEPGEKVGVIGYAYDSFWARLARVRIVAEMLDRDAVDLWSGDESLQESVLQAFAGAGARAVIAEDVPGDIQLEGWHSGSMLT